MQESGNKFEKINGLVDKLVKRI